MDTADRPGLVSLAARTAPAPIASMLHFAGLLVITACVVALGFYSQSDSAGATPDGQLASHAMAIQIYIFAIVLDWGLFWYCWFGMRRRNCSLWTLADLRWISWRSIVVDILFALALWIIWEGTDHGVSGLLGPSVAKSVDNLLPQSLLEIIVWIITSVTAGICKESVFRGYVQRQVTRRHSKSVLCGVAALRSPRRPRPSSPLLGSTAKAPTCDEVLPAAQPTWDRQHLLLPNRARNSGIHTW